MTLPRLVLALGLFLAVLSGCHRPEPTTVVSAIFASGVVAAEDGVSIAYEIRGSGEPTLVFVHCWSCNREFWRHQLDALDERYQVVAMDLPGHGASGRERQEWTLAQLGADVATLVRALDLEDVVLVGHSMGGPVSLEAARRVPDRVVGILCLDTLQNAEFEFPREMTESFAARLESDREGFMDEFIPAMFPQGTSPELQKWVRDESLEADAKATAELMRDFGSFDAKAAFAAAGVPIRCVNASAMASRGMPTEVEVNRRYADYDAVMVDDVGHFLHLEKPDEINAHLETLLADLLP